MGEVGSVGARRSGRLVGKWSDGPVVVMDVDEGEDGDVGEVGVGVEEAEAWEPGAGRKLSARKGVGRRTKRGEKGEKTMGFDAVLHGLGSVNLSEVDKGDSREAGVVGSVVKAVKSYLEGEAKSCPGDVAAFESTVRSLVEDKGESGAQEFILNAVRSYLQEKLGNSRGSETVLNAASQGLVGVDPDMMERPSFVRTVSRKEKVVDLSSGSSDDGDEGDDCTDDESAGEQEEIDTTLGSEDAALFAEVTKVLREGGDLKKLRVDHLKAYLRRHGLRMSGVKAVLLSRCEDHLRLKDRQVENIYPRSSFSINCKGDVCLGDTVLFLQNVYEPFKIVSRNAKPLGKRWVAGKVVNESYGAGKQQHTFTIEVLWSTGTQPFYLMRPLQIKGRNLYRINTMRQPWSNEADRKKVLDEKHARGAEARAQRRAVTGLSSRGHSRSRPSSRGRSKTRDQGRTSRSVPPTIPPQNSVQHERNRTQQINIHEGSIAAQSHIRIRLAESDRIPPTIPAFQNSMRHGWGHVHQQGRIQTEQRGWTQTDQQGRIHSEQHGSTHTENHVYQGSTRPQGIMAHTQGIVRIGCSTRGCEKAGAKQCISRSCASCCYKNTSTRGSCLRHQ